MSELLDGIGQEMNNVFLNLKKLNVIIIAAQVAIQNATAAAADVGVGVGVGGLNLSQPGDDESLSGTGGMNDDEAQPPTVAKKKASRKKRATAAQKAAAAQAETEAQEALDQGNQLLNDPSGTNSHVAGGQESFLDNPDEPFSEPVIEITEVRTRMQTVAMSLNGETQLIADAMKSKFNKIKLSDFKQSEYPALLEAIEALVDPVADGGYVDPMG